MAEEDSSPGRQQWARQMLETGRERLPRAVPFELQAVALAPGMLLLFWPGEIASEYALWAKREIEREGGPRVLTIAYCNGAVGYVPSAAMYPLGGYEVNSSHYYYNLPAPYAPDIEARLQKVIREMVDRELLNGMQAGPLH